MERNERSCPAHPEQVQKDREGSTRISFSRGQRSSRDQGLHAQSYQRSVRDAEPNRGILTRTCRGHPGAVEPQVYLTYGDLCDPKLKTGILPQAVLPRVPPRELLGAIQQFLSTARAWGVHYMYDEFGTPSTLLRGDVAFRASRDRGEEAGYM